MQRLRLIVLTLVAILWDGVALAQLKAPFGTGNELTYDLESGQYSIRYGDFPVICQAAAAVVVNGKKYSSEEAVKRSFSEEPFSDALGSGKKYTVAWQFTDAPVIRQHFYCYATQEFLTTELEVAGRALRSNYMAPLLTSQGGLPIRGRAETLFVPFDNDTFIRYRTHVLSDTANTSAEVGAIFDASSKKGLVTGSLIHTDWKTGVRSAGQGGTLTQLEVWAGYSDVAVTRDSMPHGAVKGDTIFSPKMFIGYFDDWQEGMESYAHATAVLNSRYIAAWEHATPVGWNSWGEIKEHLTYEKATGVADFFDTEIPDFRNEDGTAYIDLDSFWDNMVEGGYRGDFSNLKAFVAYCRARGLQPGVYWAPFTDWGHRSRRDRVAEGSDYHFSEMWTRTATGYHDLDGGRALDPTHPGTRKRMEFVINKLKECGFKMIKVDFLGHAAIESTGFYDPSVTTGMQAYRAGMEYLCDLLDNQMLVYAAISPSLATARYVHMRRIACDAWKTIKDTEYTLNGVTYGWWQDGLYDYIDADHLVFAGESIGANRARLISGLVTGPVILGDDYSVAAPWQQHVKQWLQRPAIHTLLQSGKTFRPVEGNANLLASRVFIRHEEEGAYLAVFNYRKEPGKQTLEMSALGLDPDATYRAEELLDGSSETFNAHFTVDFDGEGAYIYRLTKAN